MEKNMKRLTKQGNSVSVVIEKPILEVLGARSDYFVKRTIEGNKLILEFVSPEERSKILKKASKEIIETHAKSFKKLAE